MNTFLRADINLLSFIILAIILVNISKRKNWRQLSDRLYMKLVISIMLILLIDAFAWVFNEQPQQINRILNIGSNMMLYLLAPIPGILWALYANYLIYNNIFRLRKIIKYLIIPMFLNTMLAVASVYTPTYFYVDVFNTYHRGPFYFVHVVILLSYVLYTTVLAVLNKNRLDRNKLQSILLYPLSPIVGGLMQMYLYGTLLFYNGYALSLLIIYLNLQTKHINTDFLTGAHNRSYMQEYLAYLKQVKISKPITVYMVLIDMDNLKEINDLYGHEEGDHAIKSMVDLIKKTAGEKGIVIRRGGDEFVVILNIQGITNDEPDRFEAELREITRKNNSTWDKPYKLMFSYGSAVYSSGDDKEPEEVLKEIDRLMYEEKKTKKAQNNKYI